MPTGWGKSKTVKLMVAENSNMPQAGEWCHAPFSFFTAPVNKSVTPSFRANLKSVYNYVRSSVKAGRATWELRRISDRKEASKFKAEHLDFVTFSGLFNYRNAQGLLSHSGLLCLDFDHLGPDKQRAKELLIADPCFETQLLFTSPSGDGLKWVVTIEVSEENPHEKWFQAIGNYLAETYRLIVDPSGKDVCRACFLPFDGECYCHPSILLEPHVAPF